MRGAWALLVGGLVLAQAVPVLAQEGEAGEVSDAQLERRTKARAGGLLSLISERVVEGGEQAPRESFWWSKAGAIADTESDEDLRTALKGRGLGLFRPMQGKVSSISKIYRRAQLSRSQASSLGQLLGARRVLRGWVSYERLRPSTVLSMWGWRARLEVEMIAVGGAQAQVERRFVLEREVFSLRGEGALSRLRGEVAGVFARLLELGLRPRSGAAGVSVGEVLIGLRRVESASIKEKIKEKLEGLEGVNAARLRWVSEGQLVWELNPGVSDSEEKVRGWARQLGAQSFEGFKLVEQKSERADVVSFELQAEVSEEGGGG